MKLDVIGFGALNMDKLHRTDKIAERGEESFITGYSTYPGGSAANTVVGLSRLGARVGYIGKVSNDVEGKILLQNLIDENVDVSGVLVSNEGRSGSVIGFIDGEGERSLYVDPGVNDILEFDEINLSYANNTEFLHVTSFVGEAPFKAQKKLLKNIEVKVSFDPGTLYARRGLNALRFILKKSYVVLPNEYELRMLTGRGYKQGSETLIKEGAQIVAVKLGDKGCYVTDGEESYLINTSRVKVVDTTGAGDAYCAGFLHGLIYNKDLYACGKLGNFVASCSIGSFGARQGLPKLSDLSNI